MTDSHVDNAGRRGLLARPNLWISVGVLGVAMSLTIAAWFKATTRELPTEPLRHIMPTELAGWSVTDVPLGPTETGADVVVGMLQFDDYVFRRYSRSAEYFGIYIAYWGPEKMAVGEVAKHTPDVCWVQNGMKRLQAENQVGLSVGQARLLNAEVRLFSAGQSNIHVAYWHIVNGRVLDHSQRQGWSLQGLRYWVDSFKRLWSDGRAEQYFVRVDSSMPIEQLVQTPDFIAAFEKLRFLQAGNGLR